MLKSLYRIGVDVISNREKIAQYNFYAVTLDEAIQDVDNLSCFIEEQYKKKYDLNEVDVDYREYNNCFVVATKDIYPFKEHKHFTKIEIVAMVKNKNENVDLKSISRDISER